MRQNHIAAIGLFLLAACSHASQSSGGASAPPPAGIDSAQAVAIAMDAIQPGASTHPLTVEKFEHDKSGFTIELLPVPPPGKLILGGGGLVHLTNKGQVKSVVLYQ